MSCLSLSFSFYKSVLSLTFSEGLIYISISVERWSQMSRSSSLLHMCSGQHWSSRPSGPSGKIIRVPWHFLCLWSCRATAANLTSHDEDEKVQSSGTVGYFPQSPSAVISDLLFTLSTGIWLWGLFSPHHYAWIEHLGLAMVNSTVWAND